jgi:hypothetical protein
MSDADRVYAPRGERHVVTGRDRLSISACVDPEQGPIEELSAELLDISRRGAKLRIMSELRDVKHLQLRLQSPKLLGPVDVDGKVCWTDPGADGVAYLGVAFAPPLPALVFDSLVGRSTAANRRVEKRDAVSLHVCGRWEMAQGGFEGEITDICPGGFCITSLQGGGPRSRVLLSFDYEGKSVRVTGQTQWQVHAAHQFVAGCQFVTPNGYSILRKVAKLAATNATR